MRNALLQRTVSNLSGVYSDSVVEAINENPSMPDFVSVSGASERRDHSFDAVLRDSDFDLQLWQQRYHVFAATVQRGMFLPTADTLDVGYGYVPHLDPGQSDMDVVQAMGIYDRSDHFHRH